MNEKLEKPDFKRIRWENVKIAMIQFEEEMDKFENGVEAELSNLRVCLEEAEERIEEMEIQQTKLVDADLTFRRDSTERMDGLLRENKTFVGLYDLECSKNRELIKRLLIYEKME